MSELMANCGLHSDQVYVCKHCAESQLSQARAEIASLISAQQGFIELRDHDRAKFSKLELVRVALDKVLDWALVNRGSRENERICCYTYGTKNGKPKKEPVIERLIKNYGEKMSNHPSLFLTILL